MCNAGKAAHCTHTAHRVELVQVPGVGISVQKHIFQSSNVSALFREQQTELGIQTPSLKRKGSSLLVYARANL